MNDAEKTYWVKRSDGWVQGSLVYTATNATTISVPGQTLLFHTWSGNEIRGTSMSWEAVDFLLQHLGFTRTSHPDYVTYTYRDLTQYAFSLCTGSDVGQWTDSGVREIFVYAQMLITKYEENTPPPPPAPVAPKHEFEVEDW